jgi:hypothetical protein
MWLDAPAGATAAVLAKKAATSVKATRFPRERFARRSIADFWFWFAGIFDIPI